MIDFSGLVGAFTEFVVILFFGGIALFLMFYNPVEKSKDDLDYDYDNYRKRLEDTDKFLARIARGQNWKKSWMNSRMMKWKQ